MKKPQMFPFFVYGTLRVGQPNFSHLQGIDKVERNVWLSEHVLVAPYQAPFPFLMELGSLPHGMSNLVDETVEMLDVQGDLIWIKPEAYVETLEFLDQLERVPELYQRKIVEVDTGQQTAMVAAWVYYLPSNTELAQILLHNPFLPSNNWLDR